jgi:hypothetical protein
LRLTGRASCCVGFLFRLPKQKPNKIIDDQDKNKSSIELRLLKLLLILPKKMKIYS